MGRRPDSPEDQEVKGFPGKRKKKTERLMEAAELRAQRLAAAPGETSDVLSPPAAISDPLLADALFIWKRYAPMLHKENLFEDVDRLTFAMYCVYQAEFFAADQDIRQNGYYKMVKSTTGDRRPWTNPSVEQRELAAKMSLELAKRFGLTPLDRSELVRRHSNMGDGPLFGGDRKAAEKESSPAPAQPPVIEDDAIGVLERLDSPGPTSVN